MLGGEGVLMIAASSANIVGIGFMSVLVWVEWIRISLGRDLLAAAKCRGKCSFDPPCCRSHYYVQSQFGLVTQGFSRYCGVSQLSLPSAWISAGWEAHIFQSQIFSKVDGRSDDDRINCRGCGWLRTWLPHILGSLPLTTFEGDTDPAIVVKHCDDHKGSAIRGLKVGGLIM